MTSPRSKRSFAKPSRSTGLANRKVRSKAKAAKPALLAGGNPQIAKADGDPAVQAYIAAMPGWKRDESKHKDVRYFDIHEDDQRDEELLASWIRQASQLPGWIP